MRASNFSADVSGYVSAVSESMVMLAEVEAEEMAAAVSRVRFWEGEIVAARLRDEVGEAAIRAARVRRRLDAARERWAALVAETGAFPAYLPIPLDRNVHRILSVCERIESFEREAAEEVAKDDRLRAESRALYGPAGS